LTTIIMSPSRFVANIRPVSESRSCKILSRHKVRDAYAEKRGWPANEFTKKVLLAAGGIDRLTGAAPGIGSQVREDDVFVVWKLDRYSKTTRILPDSLPAHRLPFGDLLVMMKPQLLEFHSIENRFRQKEVL
jgi:hypothetical protein